MRRPGIVAPNGTPTNPQLMLGWQPGAVSCDIRFLQQNNLFAYKQAHPDATIIVRFEHPANWFTDLEATAVQYARQIAAQWNAIKPLQPLVIFAEAMNLATTADGAFDPARQSLFESEQFYRSAGWWIARVAQVVKALAPDMQLVAPPFSPGRHEDGAPDAQGNITEPFAGYDFLADAVGKYFDNRLAVYACWGDDTGSRREWLQNPQQSVWHAFRWRRVLALFEKRYNLAAKVVINRACNFATYDPDFFEQIVFFARHTLNDDRVEALTFYLWEDPSFEPATIFNVWTQYLPDLPAFTRRLAALPDILPGSIPPTDTIPAPPKPVTTPNDAAFGGMSIRVKLGNGRIETMTLENYLRAVVPAEIPATWHPEALKAQAIAARSYAANAIRRARYLGKKFDITTDPAIDQNYRPDKIHIATDKAILATAGLVAIYNRHPIDAVYSANCGGHTRNSEDVFKKADGSPASPTPYLRGVSCPAPGPKNGHGVGMCQHGAQTFAKQGYTFEQILKHYYTGISIEPWQYTPPPSITGAESAGITEPGNWQVSIKRTPGLALIVGNLADKPNIPITVTTPRGDSFVVTSGSKPEFGAGGFEALATGGTGVYRLAFLGQTFSVRVDANTTVHLDIAAKTTVAEPVAVTGSIRGTLTDSLGTPLGGRTVQLQAEHTVKVFATAADGQFLFDDLPAGTYILSDLESGISQTVTVAGDEKQISLVIPTASGGEHWVAETTELPGSIPLLVGDIGVAGEAITATAPSGATVTVKSGDKPEYGSGGFEIYAPEIGTYTLSFLGRTVAVSANGKMQRITFKQTQPEELARLISSALPLSKIESLLKELRQETDTANLFSIEALNN